MKTLSAFLLSVALLVGLSSRAQTGSEALPQPSPATGPTPAPEFYKRVGVSLSYGIFLNDPFTTSNIEGLTFNYLFSEKSGLQLDLWQISARDSDTVKYFENVLFQEPDHNLPAGFYGAHYTWTPMTSKIGASLGFLGKKDIPFELTFAPGLGLTILKSAEITAPPTYIPPTGTSQMVPTAALDISQIFYFMLHWALTIDFVNHLYPETTYSSQTGNSDGSHLTYNNAVLVGVGYSCNLPLPKKPKKPDSPEGASSTEARNDTQDDTKSEPAPNGCFW